MQGNKDRLETGDSTSDMSTKTLIKSSRLIRMIPGVEINRKAFQIEDGLYIRFEDLNRVQANHICIGYR